LGEKLRGTSKLAYEQIKAEGLLSKLRFLVYESIVLNGPATSKEVTKLYLPSLERDTVSPRMVELEALGVIRAAGERPCRVSGRMAVEWAATENLPEGKIQRVSNKEKIRRLVLLLERCRSALYVGGFGQNPLIREIDEEVKTCS
jgi:hypothetical protein